MGVSGVYIVCNDFMFYFLIFFFFRCNGDTINDQKKESKIYREKNIICLSAVFIDLSFFVPTFNLVGRFIQKLSPLSKLLILLL